MQISQEWQKILSQLNDLSTINESIVIRLMSLEEKVINLDEKINLISMEIAEKDKISLEESSSRIKSINTLLEQVKTATKLHVSLENGEISISSLSQFNDQSFLQCFTEFGMQFEKINLQHLNPEIKDSGKHFENIILMPNTLIINLWHLLHHMYLLYKFIIENRIKNPCVYPVFFKGFSNWQGEIKNSLFTPLLFKGLGLNRERFDDLHDTFKNHQHITIDQIFVNNKKLNFSSYKPKIASSCSNQYRLLRNEPLFEDFKKYVIKNMGIEYAKNKNNAVTFILRRGTREIDNINEIQSKLINLNISYVYLEDHSIEEQLRIIVNTDTLIGVHGGGLAWAFFMRNNSRLIEIHPGKLPTDNYVRWCNIAKLKYMRITAEITNSEPDENFRQANIRLNQCELNIIKKALAH